MQELLSADFLTRTLAGWSLLDWLKLVGIGVAGFVVLRLIRYLLRTYVVKAFEATRNRADDVFVVLIVGTRSFFLAFAAFYLARIWFEDSGPFGLYIGRGFALALLVQVGLWGGDVIRWWFKEWAEKQSEGDPSRLTAMRAFALIGRIVLWSILFVVALDNFGVDITALVTGLGIGGIAIALAVQNVLKDILAYVSILTDRPFAFGDFLIVGDFVGTVEEIGIKSTRLRSLSGEQLIFANTDLLGSRIRNFKRMFERRVVFSVGVEYGTPADKLERIPGIVEDAIESQQEIRFDRSHLKSFDNFAVTFENVYYIPSPDYALYMDQQQGINLFIYRRFKEEGIEFAFPTQTLHVASLPSDPDEPQGDSQSATGE